MARQDAAITIDSPIALSELPIVATLFPAWLLKPQLPEEVSPDPAVSVVVDAILEGREITPAMLVGLPATVRIGSDRRSDKVAKVSPSLKTITVESGRAFRWSPVSGRYKSRHYQLTLGIAEDHLDPSF